MTRDNTGYSFAQQSVTDQLTSPLTHCYKARNWLPTAPTDSLGLDAVAAQGLADLLPTLLCGEASAEMVFTHAIKAFPSKKFPELHDALCRIVADEKRHGDELINLSHYLPSPIKRATAKHAVRFLRSLASDNLSIHLARVSAIDIGVCIVLALVCRAPPIIKNDYICRLLTLIRRDEGRHVRVTRRCAEVLGLDIAIETKEKIQVLNTFSQLLSRQDDAFKAIGVDPEQLRAHFKKRCDYYENN